MRPPRAAAPRLCHAAQPRHHQGPQEAPVNVFLGFCKGGRFQRSVVLPLYFERATPKGVPQIQEARKPRLARCVACFFLDVGLIAAVLGVDVEMVQAREFSLAPRHKGWPPAPFIGIPECRAFACRWELEEAKPSELFVPSWHQDLCLAWHLLIRLFGRTQGSKYIKQALQVRHPFPMCELMDMRKGFQLRGFLPSASTQQGPLLT